MWRSNVKCKDASLNAREMRIEMVVLLSLIIVTGCMNPRYSPETSDSPGQNVDRLSALLPQLKSGMSSRDVTSVLGVPFGDPISDSTTGEDVWIVAHKLSPAPMQLWITWRRDKDRNRIVFERTYIHDPRNSYTMDDLYRQLEELELAKRKDPGNRDLQERIALLKTKIMHREKAIQTKPSGHQDGT